MSMIEWVEIRAPGHTSSLIVELHISICPNTPHPVVSILPESTPVKGMPGRQGDRAVVGGGAMVGRVGEGNFLTAIFPTGRATWEARSKDHFRDDSEWIIAACNVVTVPAADDFWLGHTTTPLASQHTSAVCAVPCGYELVGGGAYARWEEGGGYGNLLWSSVPVDDGAGRRVWVAAAKDHKQPSVARLTAYACGLRQSFLHELGLEVRMFTVRSLSGYTPSRTVRIPDGDWKGAFVSGGATFEGHGPGSLLTTSIPSQATKYQPPPLEEDPIRYAQSVNPEKPGAGQGWYAHGQDHIEPNQSILTVTGIAIGCPGATVQGKVVLNGVTV